MSILNPEFQDIGAGISIAAGVSAAVYASNRMGVTKADFKGLSSLFNSPVNPINNIGREASVQRMRRYRETIATRERLLRDKKSKEALGIFDRTWNGDDIFAIKDAISDMSTDPKYKGLFQVGMNAESLRNDLASISDEGTLKSWIDTKLFNPGMQTRYPSVREDLGTRIQEKEVRAGRIGRRTFRKSQSDSFTRIAKGQMVSNQIDFNGLTPESQGIANSFMDRYSDRLDKRQVQFFRMNRGRGALHDYARVSYRGTEFNVPLGKYRTSTIGGSSVIDNAPIYFYGTNQNSPIAMRRQFVRINANGKVDSVMDWEDYMFSSRGDAEIFNAIDNALSTNKSLGEVLIGKGDKLNSQYQIGEYVEDSSRGITTLIKKSSEVQILGMDDFRKANPNMGNAELYSILEDEISRSTGSQIYAFSSPGQISNNVFHMTNPRDQQGLFRVLQGEDHYSQQRRPFQIFSSPDTIENVDELRRKAGLGIGKDYAFYDPFNNPVFDSGAFREMAGTDLGKYVYNPRAALLTKKGVAKYETNLAEGQVMMRRNRLVLRGAQKSVDLHVSPDEMTPLNNRIASLLDIVDTVSDPAERKRLIQERLSNRRGSGRIRKGEILGKRMTPSGIKDASVPSGFRGNAYIEDVIPTKDGYRVQFGDLIKRHRNSEKMYGGVKGMTTYGAGAHQFINSLASDLSKGLRENLDLATGSHELSRSGQYFMLRQQQIEALKMHLGKSAGVYDRRSTPRLSFKNRRALGIEVGKAISPKYVELYDKYKERVASKYAGVGGESSSAFAVEWDAIGRGEQKAMQGFRDILGEKDWAEFDTSKRNLDREYTRNFKKAVGDRKKEKLSANKKRVEAKMYTGARGEFLQKISSNTMNADLFTRGYGRTAGISDKIASELGLGQSVVRSALGMLELTQEASGYSDLDERALGTIFGLEADAAGVLPQIIEKYRGSLGAIGFNDGFLSSVERGIANADYVIGTVPVSFRGGVGEFGRVRGGVERRSIEFMLDNNNDNYASIDVKGKPTSVADILLDDLAYSIQTMNPRKKQGAKRIMSAYSEVGGRTVAPIRVTKDNSHYSVRNLMNNGGGFADVSSLTGKADDVLYVPSRGFLAENFPESVDEYRGSFSYGNVWNKIFTNNLNPSNIDEIRTLEQQMKLEVVQEGYRGKVTHSTYEKIIPAEVDSMTNSSRAHGMGVGLSRQNVERMFADAKERLVSPEEIEELDRLYESVKKGNMFAGVVQRSPTITPYGRQLVGMYIDDSMAEEANRGIKMGRRFIKDATGALIDVSFGLAAASSHDFDGDPTSANLLLGPNSKYIHAAINDETVQKMLAARAERTILRHSVLEKVFSRNVGAKYGTDYKQVTAFAEGATALGGQGEIGMLSYHMDRIKWAARISQDSAEIAASDLESLQQLQYAMEQKGISFKHIKSGKSIGAMITDRLGGLMTRDLTLEDTGRSFNSLIEDFFGSEIFEDGIAVPNSEDKIKLSRDLGGKIANGLQIMATPEGRAAYKVATDKPEEIDAEYMLNSRSRTGATTAEAFQQNLDEASKVSNSIPLIENLRGILPENAVKGDGNLKEINEGILKKAAAMMKEVQFNKVAKPVGIGLVASALTYSMLFDRGYSSRELEAPGVNPRTGQMPMTPVGVQMRIQDGSLLAGSYSSSGSVPTPDFDPVSSSIPNESPNSIPVRSHMESSTGRINVRGIEGSEIDPNAVAASISTVMPHAQIGVTVNHNHRMSRDIDRQL